MGEKIIQITTVPYLVIDGQTYPPMLVALSASGRMFFKPVASVLNDWTEFRGPDFNKTL